MCHQAASAWDDLGQQVSISTCIKFSTGFRPNLLTVDSAVLITYFSSVR